MDDYAKKGQNFISNKAAPVCNPDGYFYRVQSRFEHILDKKWDYSNTSFRMFNTKKW